MPYDKYRNWKPGPPFEVDKLKCQVLLDLEKAEDEIEKLEILDSFEAFVERAHTADIAEHISNQILFFVRPFLTTAIEGKLPSSTPISRPRKAPAHR